MQPSSPDPVSHWVEHLGLIPHPEGGFYKETYRSDICIPANLLFEPKNGHRSLSTAIYFLITSGNFSAFHRILSDEMWHFYAGDSLLVHVLNPDNRQYSQCHIGLHVDKGQRPLAVIPAGSWFASETTGQYSLVGCTVAPGFDFHDFQLAKAGDLTHQFPEHRGVIERFCR
jgi:uncharacterized protein